MKSRSKISRLAWVLLVTSGLSLGAVWTLTHRLRPIRWAGDPDLVALVAERDALGGSNDQILAALRTQQRAVAPPPWTSERLQRFEKALPPRWVCAWGVVPAGGCRAVLTRAAPALADWPDCVALIKDLTRRPGLIIESVELVGGGTIHDRQITRMTITVRFSIAAAANDNAERAAPSRGPLSVVRGVGPAETRKVGRSPALRRPFASAEPPASGPASAPFRPDPPGSRAGAENLVSVNQIRT